MREIIFRGKLTVTGKWSDGNLQITKKGVAIINPDKTIMGSYGRVIPESVGQYSGRCDKNGTKIFEGDIVTGLFDHGIGINAIIAFKYGSFGLLEKQHNVEHFHPFTSLCNIEYEVIGNIHDNPELLKGGE